MQDLWRHLRHQAWGALPLAAALVPLLLLLSPGALAMSDDLAESAATLDRSLVETAAFVDDHHGAGLVAVKPSRQALPTGWWFEGLTNARIAVGSGEAALAFPLERERARLVNRFFDEPLTSAAAAELGRTNQVDLLVFRKWDWLGWQAWLEEPAPRIQVAYDDGTFMVIALTAQPTPAAA